MGEKIGLEAIIQDADFQAGSKRYLVTIQRMDKDTKKAADNISKGSDKVAKSWRKSAQDAAKSFESMTKQATLWGAGLTATAGAAVMVAARNEELGVVIETVGRNVGRSAEEMRSYEEGVKSMGITTGLFGFPGAAPTVPKKAVEGTMAASKAITSESQRVRDMADTSGVSERKRRSRPIRRGLPARERLPADEDRGCSSMRFHDPDDIGGTAYLIWATA